MFQMVFYKLFTAFLEIPGSWIFQPIQNLPNCLLACTCFWGWILGALWLSLWYSLSSFLRLRLGHCPLGRPTCNQECNFLAAALRWYFNTISHATLPAPLQHDSQFQDHSGLHMWIPLNHPFPIMSTCALTFCVLANRSLPFDKWVIHVCIYCLPWGWF